MGLSKVQMGYVFSAFTIAYALFEIPSGAWGDRIGAPRADADRDLVVDLHDRDRRGVQLRVDAGRPVLVRDGRGRCVPQCLADVLAMVPRLGARHGPGDLLRRAHLGGGLTPILVGALLTVLPWRLVFVMFGMVGFVWAAAWFRWFRDEPADHPAVSESERKYIESGRKPSRPHRLDFEALGQILSDRNVILLCLMYFTQAYGFYFNITWLPTYLKEARGFSGLQLNLLAGLPLILSAGADLLGGLATDFLTRRHGLRAGRCWIGGMALLTAGIGLIAGAGVGNAAPRRTADRIGGGRGQFLARRGLGLLPRHRRPSCGPRNRDHEQRRPARRLPQPDRPPLLPRERRRGLGDSALHWGLSISPVRRAGCSSIHADRSDATPTRRRWIDWHLLALYPIV